MIDLNLYKNYKLSLAEAHKTYLADSEVFVTEYKPVAAKSGWTKKFLLTFLTATFIFALIAVVVIIVTKPFSKPPVIVQPSVEAPPPPPVAADPKSDYVRIQIIEFTDTAIPADRSAVARNTTPDIEVLPSLSPVPQTTKPTPTTPKPAPVPQPKTETTPAKTENKPAVPNAAAVPAVPAIVLYSLQLDNATPAEYELLRNIAVEYNTDVTLADSTYRTTPVWTVYIPKSGSGIFIENIEVAPEASFISRSEATRFALKYGTNDTVLIKMENNTDLFHDIRVCCMALEDAKIYAQKSGITDKIFKLKKE